MSDMETRVSALEATLRAVQTRQADDEAAAIEAVKRLRSITMRPDMPADLAEILARAGLD